MPGADAGDYMQRSAMIRALRLLGRLIPGDYLKTAVYLNCIEAPRRLLRETLFAFYRYDHVYAVLREFARSYPGRFSVLEFGTSDGYSFVKLLYAIRYLNLTERVIAHTFDSFEGMPPASDARDQDWVSGDSWVEGQFRGNLAALEAYCSRRYKNYRIHPGYFEDTLDESFLGSLVSAPPVLIWIDCDYYSSARVVLTRLIDWIPSGAVIYFDDLDNLNYGARLTGEARLVHEINSGLLGENIELVYDSRLALQSGRIYRFVRIPPNRVMLRAAGTNVAASVRRHAGGSPLP